MSWLVRRAVGATLLVGAVSICAGQNTSNQQPPPSGYTLHANAREVVTDVTVTDRKGNPVHGLSAPAFHIFDNGKPQHLVTFDEHTSNEPNAPLQESAADVYSNDVVLHPPRVFNVILLDTATITLVDQMYLRQELDKFVGGLPADEPFAVFARGSEHTVMLANFTSDHQKLLAAVHRALPRMLAPGYRYVTDEALLNEICLYLEQYPGRKNVLWFTGGSNMDLRADPTALNTYIDLRPMYDQLELSRIALYPIDARGLVVDRPSGFVSQQLQMQDEADATGGHAFINTNGLADAAKRIADTDASYYTLTYSPQDVKLDNKWHKVKVEVEGGDYQLSYRRGYYDDGSTLTHADGPERKRLPESGEAVPELHTDPIIFQVRATPARQGADVAQQNIIHSSPAPPKKGERAYNLHYSVPVDAFPNHAVGAQDQVSVGLGLIAFNQYGRSVARVAEKVTLGVSQEHVDTASPGMRITFDQQINLPDGEDFLFVAVWNMETGRVGTVQVPLAVSKPKRTQSASGN